MCLALACRDIWWCGIGRGKAVSALPWHRNYSQLEAAAEACETKLRDSAAAINGCSQFSEYPIPCSGTWHKQKWKDPEVSILGELHDYHILVIIRGVGGSFCHLQMAPAIRVECGRGPVLRHQFSWNKTLSPDQDKVQSRMQSNRPVAEDIIWNIFHYVGSSHSLSLLKITCLSKLHSSY